MGKLSTTKVLFLKKKSLFVSSGRENLLGEEKKGNWKFSATFSFQTKLCVGESCIASIMLFLLFEKTMPRLPPTVVLLCGNNCFLTFEGLFYLKCFFQNGLMRHKVNFKFFVCVVETQFGSWLFFFWATTPKKSSTSRWGFHHCFYY